MGGGDSPKWAAEKEKEKALGPLSGVRVVDAPILLFVSFHKALRAELDELHRLAVSLPEIASPGHDLVLNLLRRFEFLKLAHKYHCATEDEVIFKALNLHVENVANTYFLEHRSIDNLFDSLFLCLNVLMEGVGNLSKPFQELVFCIETIRTFICRHMQKEEEQVFPMLIQHFSSKEQASLVWQFMCSIPLMLLKDFLPWMSSYLSPDEQLDVMNCIKEVVPNEKLLQEVVFSYLGNKSCPFGAYTAGNDEKGAAYFDEPTNSRDLPDVYLPIKSLSKESWSWSLPKSICSNFKHHPIDGLRLWHDAIRKDLREILNELHEMRSLKSFSTLASVSVQLKFLADVLIFYSYALERVIFPVLNELADTCLSQNYELFPYGSQLRSLLQLLQNMNAQNRKTMCNLVQKLCWKVESFMVGVNGQLAFHEAEVFPLIRKNCNHDMQLQLLFMSLHMMPLGLLKCVIPWLSVHLSDDEVKTLLHGINLAVSQNDKSFAALLHEWVRIGYSGKTSLEKFRKDLQEIFKSGSSLLSEQIKEDAGLLLNLDMKSCKKSHPGKLESNSTNNAKNCMHNSLSFHFNCTTEKYMPLYTSGMSLQIFFPGIVKLLSAFPKSSAEKNGADSIPEPNPFDQIVVLINAIKNDLDYLVTESVKMAKNVGLLTEFCRRFHLIRFIYQIHAIAEDEIAFPMLEAKGKLKNIGLSYSIDHKLDLKHLNDISTVLDEMSKLYVSLPFGVFSVIDVDTLDPCVVKYRKLCMKLHSMCKSMHKILCDHVHREEIELWPLFRECFSNEEQVKFIGCVLGRIRAEILQEMIPWLMASLTPVEQHAMMSLWRKATKNTMFDEWLGEWWEGTNNNDIEKVKKESSIPLSQTTDPLEVITAYLSKESFKNREREILHEQGLMPPQKHYAGDTFKLSESGKLSDKGQTLDANMDSHQYSEGAKFYTATDGQRHNHVVDVRDQTDKLQQLLQEDKKFSHEKEDPFTRSQEDLQDAIRRVSRDDSLDPQKKTRVIQNLLMSRWIAMQRKSQSEITGLISGDEIPGQCPSYRESLQLSYGCRHYKRNCKLLAACCNQLFTCQYCHDDAVDHSMDGKSTTEMMCMKCLKIQPLGPTCVNASCHLSMARYFCRICKLYDDEREIYHCPYCNLCRLGKGLGIDYFHCMNCNACMSRSLTVHVCREKCFEDNCPICHEYIFTSRSPVKALPCGHLMHSKCFQDYTCTHYTCPICSKTLGNMQVYFGMLDALLSEEKMPDEYSGKTQPILCNDCEKRGVSPYHWLYHKCPHCGSYNTRLL